MVGAHASTVPRTSGGVPRAIKPNAARADSGSPRSKAGALWSVEVAYVPRAQQETHVAAGGHACCTECTCPVPERRMSQKRRGSDSVLRLGNVYDDQQEFLHCRRLLPGAQIIVRLAARVYCGARGHGVGAAGDHGQGDVVFTGGDISDPMQGVLTFV